MGSFQGEEQDVGSNFVTYLLLISNVEGDVAYALYRVRAIPAAEHDRSVAHHLQVLTIPKSKLGEV